MSKIVKKFLLDDGWSIGKNESWFADMAEKGLHLKSIGCVFASFEKGEPSKSKYRIDVLQQKPSQEQLDVYKECGWDIVTVRGNFYIFSSPESSDSPELHTDPAEQSYTLVDLDRRLRSNLIIISLMMLLFFGIMFSVFFIDRRPFLSMVRGMFIQQILLVIVELYGFYAIIRNYIAVRILRKSLSEGQPINHKENWRRSHFINGTVSILVLTIAVLSILNPIAQMIKSKEYTLPEAVSDLPIVRLEEIEQNPNFEREIFYNSEGVDWGNHVNYNWSVLAPVQYEVDEHGIVNNEMWGDKSGTYSPSIHTQFYQLAFPAIADGLIHDLMDRYLYKTDITRQKVDTDLFDQVYISVEGIEKQIFASLNNNVIHVRYYGNKDAAHILSLISSTISE